ncbi:MAG: hypothetical protein H0U67_13735 [Gemmatimonadetes bacterium]|nr:hypothetical protein [Gemmatimonadota bacterium]
MNFKRATDILGVSAAALAEVFRLQPQTVRQMRLDPESLSYRTPPENWRPVVASLARQRARELERLADELER